ncbi:Endoglucanase-5 [Lachnellula hyalina]|uniref:Cellulase n=1 Tax=Lachnellula hyalina TaxID=1316788 RepID=A0A8H8QWL6_9HELO|nr:Endoglucanase-5 [Lachnellula hyalina]TVY24167.1 Endoglucanase-5 [Lachnellula hyalina]
MKSSTLLFTLTTCISSTLAQSGQATTTRYYDGLKGACGCGPATGNSMFSWQSSIGTGIYTAAVSQALYDTGGLSWCGAGCGKCYQLTSTGSAPCSSCGTGGASGQSIIVMATNLCPNSGNAQWCASVGGTNDYGFEYHFDIMAQSEVLGDNPVVDFEEVTCPSAALTDYAQCQCA